MYAWHSLINASIIRELCFFERSSSRSLCPSVCLCVCLSVCLSLEQLAVFFISLLDIYHQKLFKFLENVRISSLLIAIMSIPSVRPYVLISNCLSLMTYFYYLQSEIGIISRNWAYIKNNNNAIYARFVFCLRGVTKTKTRTL